MKIELVKWEHDPADAGVVLRFDIEAAARLITAASVLMDDRSRWSDSRLAEDARAFRAAVRDLLG